MTLRSRGPWPLLLAALAGCPAPASNPCSDDRYCPPETVCGDDVCLVEPGACPGFPGRPPCLESFGTGHCTDGLCTPGVQVSGRIDRVPLLDGLEGAQVAILDRPEVRPAASLVRGYFTIEGVPERSTIALVIDHEGFIGGLSRWLPVGDTDLVIDTDPDEGLALVSEDFFAQAAGDLALALDPSLGMLAARVDDGAGEGLGGASAEVSPPCELGPWYLDGALQVQPDATETFAVAGVFVFANCAPGDRTIAVTHATLPACGLVPSAPDAGSVPIAPVAAGRLTYAGRMTCATP